MKHKPTTIPFPGNNPTFLVTWLGQVVSLVGSGLTSFALGVWVFERTGSPTLFAYIGLFAVLPKVFFSPAAGALVDRFDRRKIMILSDTGAGLSTLFISLMIFSGRLELWHIYLSAAANALCGTFQWPAYSASVAQLVPQERLSRANGMIQFGRAAAEIFSPLLAGTLMVSIQLEGVILIDVVTFFFAIFTLLTVRFPQLENKPARIKPSNFKAEMTFGWRYIQTHRGLLNLLLFLLVVNFLWGIVGALIVPMILSFTSSEILGTIITIAGAGMLTGSILMSVWGGPKRRVRGIIFFELISGVCFMLMGFRPNFWLVAVGAFGAHLTIAIVYGLNQTIWQTIVEPENHGRVFAAQQMFRSFTTPIAYLSAGPLAEKLIEPLIASKGMLSLKLTALVGSGAGRGIGLIFVLMGLVKIMISISAFLNPRIRLIEAKAPHASTTYL